LAISIQHSAFSPETFWNTEKKAFTAKYAKVAKERHEKENHGIRWLTKQEAQRTRKCLRAEC
jgi:hypothetical protein